jgi:exopolyphosphatase/guanosine-5'-triphosphate,3'-diphosphate pyrophosphatase
MQMTIREHDGGLRIYQGQLASGQMRDYVLEDLQGRRGDGLSPNPITPETAAAARDHAAAFAAREIPANIRARLASPDTVVVGIGALKYYGDPDPDRATTCTVEGLEHTLANLIGRSDEQIGGPYAKTQVSDRLLIVGFMRALGITRMTLANIDLSDGLLFHSDYWSADFQLHEPR